jgi:hypothetical protein
MTISDTQRQILADAAQHEARLATAPDSLPAAARNAVFRSMIKHGLLVEIPAPQAYIGLGWRQDEAGPWIALRITTVHSAEGATEPAFQADHDQPGRGARQVACRCASKRDLRPRD